jgi:hypothetical protein
MRRRLAALAVTLMPILSIVMAGSANWAWR